VVAVTVRVTAAVALAPPLVPVMVIGLDTGVVMFAVVAIVTVIVDGVVPFRMTLPPFGKLHVAPAGKPVQLLGVKLTVPVKPLAGVIMMFVVVELPAETLGGLDDGDIVNGTVTVTVAAVGDVELLLVSFPPNEAVTLSVPAGNAVVVKLATPPDTAAVPSSVDPLL